MTWRAPAVGLAAGLLLAASLPPWGWWVLGLAGAAVAFGAIKVAPWRQRLVVGLAVGAGLYGPGLWWVNEFHVAGFLAIVVLEAAILGLALSVVRPGRGRALAFPAALVLAEAVRGAWPFGGLPLGGIELGQVGGPLLPAARLGGHLLVVGLTGSAGVALAHAAGWIRRRDRVSARTAGVAAAATVALIGGGLVAPSGRPAGTIAIAAVQGGGERGTRAVDSDPRAVFDAHVAATALVTGPVDLVLWPEDVIDIERPFVGSDEQAAVSALARNLGATLVVGVVEEGAGDGLTFRNAAIAVGPDGEVGDRYDKVHRVPFGEYVPLRGLVERLADVSAVPRDAEAGSGSGRLDTAVGPMGVTISFEVFFADRARAAVRAGGRLLLVPTNASSYTTSQVPTQEVAVARLRAVETGRWVVQAAPTGYSAVIDHRGRLRQRGPLGDRAVLTATVGLRDGRTWAVSLGDAPVVILALILALGAGVFGRRRVVT